MSISDHGYQNGWEKQLDTKKEKKEPKAKQNETWLDA